MISFLDDDVYLADESERNEYVLSDNTISYYGNFYSIYQRGWNLGQVTTDLIKVFFFCQCETSTVLFSMHKQIYPRREPHRRCKPR